MNPPFQRPAKGCDALPRISIRMTSMTTRATATTLTAVAMTDDRGDGNEEDN
jgi:hypothetical protein